MAPIPQGFACGRGLFRALLGKIEPESQNVFPARAAPGRYFSGFSKCKKMLDERCGVANWTLHDLRRTFASGLAGQGVAIHVVEKLLNHISGTFAGIVGVYQRHNFFPEMKDALERWEAHLAKITLP